MTRARAFLGLIKLFQNPPFGLQLTSSTALLLMKTIAHGILASSSLLAMMGHIWWNEKTVLVSTRTLWTTTTTNWVQRARDSLVYYTWRKITILKHVGHQKEQLNCSVRTLTHILCNNNYYRFLSLVIGQFCGNKWQQPVKPSLSKMLNYLPSYFCFLLVLILPQYQSNSYITLLEPKLQLIIPVGVPNITASNSKTTPNLRKHYMCNTYKFKKTQLNCD